MVQHWYNIVVCNNVVRNIMSTFPCNFVYNVVCKIQNKRIIRMADKDVIVGACGVIIATVLKRRRRRRRNRTVWTRGWIRNRQQFGVYHQLLKELQLSDVSSYRNFLRMDVSTFEELLRFTGPAITYQDTNMRQAISPAERLALTLRFLATG